MLSARVIYARWRLRFDRQLLRSGQKLPTCGRIFDVRASIAADRDSFAGRDRGGQSRTAGEMAAVRAELREAELRLEAKIEAVRALIGEAKADVLTRVFAMIAGAIVINVIAIFGAMIGIAKLLGH